MLKKTEYLLLTYADTILSEKIKNSENLHFLSITLNNLGCYYTIKNKVNAALQYFKKARDIENFSLDRDTPKAIANLNMCILNFKLQHYKKALEFAQTAEITIANKILGPKKLHNSHVLKGLISENM
mmetsp:Transcript_38808/g.34504  ORF Transcript_38808/g.34504 Transcript_38808/m.34504 type:complete len:127 (-) Transcript_38808:1091-1471(-)